MMVDYNPAHQGASQIVRLAKPVAVVMACGYWCVEGKVVVCLLFYVLASFKVISGRIPTCDSAHSWRLYSAASLGHQVAGTMTFYITQSHYPNTELTSHCLIRIMPKTKLGSDKCRF